MFKIPSAHKSYGTISLYNPAPHRGTAFFTNYYLSFWWCHINYNPSYYLEMLL